MLIERYQLYEKELALNRFIDSSPIYTALDPSEKVLMVDQARYMRLYRETLEERIRRIEHRLSDMPRTPAPASVPGEGLPIHPRPDPAGDGPNYAQTDKDDYAASAPTPAADPPPSVVSGGGGDYAGGGASGGWSSSDSGSSSSSDSGSSSSSSSSD